LATDESGSDSEHSGITTSSSCSSFSDDLRNGHHHHHHHHRERHISDDRAYLPNYAVEEPTSLPAHLGCRQEEAQLESESDKSISMATICVGEKSPKYQARSASTTSFASDISIAGSEAALETSSEGTNTFKDTASTGPRLGPKPHTPTVAPRCASPPSNMYFPHYFDEQLVIENVTDSCDEPLETSVDPPLAAEEATVEGVTAQQLFFNIEQLTFQAKESFEFARVNTFKASKSAVNKERLSNVGKTMVDQAKSKKFEFFKALTNTSTTTDTTSNVANDMNKEPPVVAAENPSLTSAGSKLMRSISKDWMGNLGYPSSYPPQQQQQLPQQQRMQQPASPQQQRLSKVPMEEVPPKQMQDRSDPPKQTEHSAEPIPVCEDQLVQSNGSAKPVANTIDIAPTRPLSPRYNITFPRSSLDNIASQRPTSRIPKSELAAKTKPSPMTTLPPRTPTVNISTQNAADQQETSLETGLTNPTSQRPLAVALPSGLQSAADTPLSPRHKKVGDTPSKHSPRHPGPRETTTSRFLDEHHPQMSRSNSTLSNVSTYTNTTQDLFSSISSDLSGIASQTSNLLESMFGYTAGGSATNSSSSMVDQRYLISAGGSVSGTRFAGVSTDNHATIKDAVDRVLLGEGVGWLKLSRLKRLMEDETHRSLMLSYLHRKFGQHLTRDGHIEDLCLDKTIWKGVSRLLSAVIYGIESSLSHGNSNSTVGIASAFQLLELAHTHYWSNGASPSMASSPVVAGPVASDVADLGVEEPQAVNYALERTVSPEWGSSTLQDNAFETESETGSISNFSDTGSLVSHPTYRNNPTAFHKLATNNSFITEKPRARSAVSQGEISGPIVNNDCLLRKSSLAGRYRFRRGTLVSATDGTEGDKTYLFEGFVPLTQLKMVDPPATPSKERRTSVITAVGTNNPSFLWHDMQFWEDLFCDAVAQERDIIGMDTCADELLDRYHSLAENEKRVLEHDEDRLLAVVLYNLAAFMLMMQVRHSE
jgi:hypothetical protein